MHFIICLKLKASFLETVHYHSLLRVQIVEQGITYQIFLKILLIVDTTFIKTYSYGIGFYIKNQITRHKKGRRSDLFISFNY